MDWLADIQPRLEALGWRVADIRLNGAGRMVLLLEKADGTSVAMFQTDARELAQGRTNLQRIIERNMGADLADPWPLPR